jgi:glyoxylase-like metal-dependent hydrolase (beta-lactamase superfamily II)
MIEMVEQGAGDEWVDMMHRMTEGATDGTRVVKPDMAVANKQTLTLGGHHFDIIHLGKAHTATDIMVLYREDNVLFTGDNAGNDRILRVDHGSFKGNIDTLQAGIDARPAHVVPGHGKTGGIEVLKNYQRYLATIYKSVKKGYDEDLSDFEMKPKIHAALKPYHSWSGYDDELGKHISETFLEIEAADF